MDYVQYKYTLQYVHAPSMHPPVITPSYVTHLHFCTAAVVLVLFKLVHLGQISALASISCTVVTRCRLCRVYVRKPATSLETTHIPDRQGCTCCCWLLCCGCAEAGAREKSCVACETRRLLRVAAKAGG